MNWITKLFTGREFMPLSDYDDIIPMNYTDYYYSKVMLWIESCKEFGQMNAAKRLIELFENKYPERDNHKLVQDLKRKYQQIKRSLITNN